MTKGLKVELIYSTEEDLQGKYLSYRSSINNIEDLIKKLYYIKLNETYVANMPEEELLQWSTMIDSELNKRYGSGEFKIIKDINV